VLKKPLYFLVIILSVVVLATIGYFIIHKKEETTSNKKEDKLKNVLVITLDTTRADRLGCYGYKRNTTPNIDALSAVGVQFNFAYSPVPLTLPSHCTIFTGTYPLFHRVRNNGNYLLPSQLTTLAEIFKDNGYKTSAFVSSFTVDSRFGLDQGFDHYDDRMTVGERLEQMSSERIAEITFETFKLWINKNYQSGFFCWLHFFDPHYPYEPPEPYISKFSPNPYDGEVAYMDEYIGKAVNLLKNLGILGKTLLILAGDHGEAFGEHQEMGHQVFCYEENIRVPLIFYAQDQLKKNLKVNQKVCLIDVFPTILDIMGLPRPKSVQGLSLLPALQGKAIPERSLYFESYFSYEVMACAPVIGVLQGGHKFIDLPKPELYNLKSDPSERKNIFYSSRDISKKLKSELGDLISRYQQDDLQSQRELTAKEKEKLISLGYLTGSSQNQLKKQGLPDPKDRIDAFLEYSQADSMLQQGDLKKAEVGFKKSLEMNPLFAPVYARLASVYSQQGRLRESGQILKEAMKKIPGDFGLKIEYATLLFKLNERQEALEFMDSFDDSCTADLKVKMELLYAQIYEVEKEVEKAIYFYKKVIEAEPDNIPVNKKLLLLLSQTNRLKETIPIYRRLERENPNDNDLIQRMAIVFGFTGNFEESEKYFNRAFSKNHPPRLYFDYSIVLSIKKDFRKALINMEKFLTLVDSNHPRYKAAHNLIVRYKTLLGQNPK
jgi:arylsulfatase A-like enzyme